MAKLENEYEIQAYLGFRNQALYALYVFERNQFERLSRTIKACHLNCYEFDRTINTGIEVKDEPPRQWAIIYVQNASRDVGAAYSSLKRLSGMLIVELKKQTVCHPRYSDVSSVRCAQLFSRPREYIAVSIHHGQLPVLLLPFEMSMVQQLTMMDHVLRNV